jgi:hypothetical protein
MAISYGRPIVPEEIAPSAKDDDVLVFRIKFRERSFRPGVISCGEANPYGHPSPQLLEGPR